MINNKLNKLTIRIVEEKFRRVFVFYHRYRNIYSTRYITSTSNYIDHDASGIRSKSHLLSGMVKGSTVIKSITR